MAERTMNERCTRCDQLQPDCICPHPTTQKETKMSRPIKNITEHGISMYRYRNCRCDICKEAAAQQRMRFRPKTDNKKIRLDGEPLVSRIIKDDRQANINTNLISKWRRFGIDIYNADEWCIKLGYHPTEIWGNDFYQQTNEEELVNA
jgi:hypothetical protein